MTAVGSKIRYIDGVGLCKVEVLVAEEDVKKRHEEVEKKIEELWQKAEPFSLDFGYKNIRVILQKNMNIIELLIESHKKGLALSVELNKRNRTAHLYRYTHEEGAVNYHIELVEFEELLDTFLAIKDTAERVCVNNKEQLEFLYSFVDELYENDFEDPLQAVEKAVKQVFGGEGA